MTAATIAEDLDQPTPTPAEPSRPRSTDRTTVGVTVAVAVLPVAVDLGINGRPRLFAYTAADAFYYLVVARNWARHGFPSYDGRRPTNGFHPLWQVLEAGVTWLAHRAGIGPNGLIGLVLGLQLLMIAAAIIVLARVLVRAHGRLTRWFALLPFGWYAVVLAPFWVAAGALSQRGVNRIEGPMPLYGTLWSVVNGMETPLVVALFSLVLWLLVSDPLRTRRSAVGLGCALGALTLARLDVGFIAAAIAVAWLALARARRDPVGFRRAAIAAAVLGGLVLAYLAVNRFYYGSALPTSGATKSTFPRPNLHNWGDLKSVLAGDSIAGAAVHLCRHGPMLITAAVAAVYLVTTARPAWRRARSAAHLDASARYTWALCATACGVLALSTYDWLFVWVAHQGHWYWPISVLFVTLVGFEWTTRVAEWRASRAEATPTARPVRQRRPAWVAHAPLTLLTIGCVVGFLVLGHPDGYHARYAAFALDVAPEVRAALLEHDPDGPRIYSIDDGLDAWALDLPAMSGIGLMLDGPAHDAAEDGDLLHLGVDRGHDHITSVIYLDTRGLSPDTSSEAIRRRLKSAFFPYDMRGIHFSVEYVSEAVPNAMGGPRPVVVIRAERTSR